MTTQPQVWLTDDDLTDDQAERVHAELQAAAGYWANIADQLADTKRNLRKYLPGASIRTEFPISDIRHDRLNDRLGDVIEMADHLAAVYRRASQQVEQPTSEA